MKRIDLMPMTVRNAAQTINSNISSFLRKNGCTSINYVQIADGYWTMSDEDYSWFILKWGDVK